MSELLPCVEVQARGEAEAGTVLWLHGLGADGHDFEPIVPYLDLPQIRFVFPHAPSRPVTINGGMVMPAWYDVLHFDRGGISMSDVRGSTEQIEALLAREEARGVAASRIVLAGFSQGGAVALHTGIRYPRTLLGLMVLSAYELAPEMRDAEASEANAMTSLLFCHGTHDPVIPVQRGREAYERYAQARRAEWHEFPMGHEVSPPEIQVMSSWLGRLFGVGS